MVIRLSDPEFKLQGLFAAYSGRPCNLMRACEPRLRVQLLLPSQILLAQVFVTLKLLNGFC
jgi:hypothetical protein